LYTNKLEEPYKNIKEYEGLGGQLKETLPQVNRKQEFYKNKLEEPLQENNLNQNIQKAINLQNLELERMIEKENSDFNKRMVTEIQGGTRSFSSSMINLETGKPIGQINEENLNLTKEIEKNTIFNKENINTMNLPTIKEQNKIFETQPGLYKNIQSDREELYKDVTDEPHINKLKEHVNEVRHSRIPTPPEIPHSFHKKREESTTQKRYLK
jgi:hypothetical protein